MTLFENFLEYCNQDNKKLKEDIETWLCDYFDFPNRSLKILKDEGVWIRDNLSENTQRRILGSTLKDAELEFGKTY